MLSYTALLAFGVPKAIAKKWAPSPLQLESLSAASASCIKALSKAQHGEEAYVLPMLIAATGGATASSTFVELGALDGQKFSNTYALEHCLGWRGVLIEADPFNFEKLMNSNRSATRIHSAVCDEATGAIPMIVGRGAMSGGRASMTEQHVRKWGFGRTGQVIKLVPCKPLHVLLMY